MCLENRQRFETQPVISRRFGMRVQPPAVPGRLPPTAPNARAEVEGAGEGSNPAHFGTYPARHNDVHFLDCRCRRSRLRRLWESEHRGRLTRPERRLGRKTLVSLEEKYGPERAPRKPAHNNGDSPDHSRTERHFSCKDLDKVAVDQPASLSRATRIGWAAGCLDVRGGRRVQCARRPANQARESG